MKNILLATTALVMTAGVASAEMTWTGTVTAGIARDGETKAVVGTLTNAELIADVASNATAAATITVNGTTFTSTTTLPSNGNVVISTTNVAAYRTKNAAIIGVIATELAAKVALAAGVDAVAQGTTLLAGYNQWLAANTALKDSTTAFDSETATDDAVSFATAPGLTSSITVEDSAATIGTQAQMWTAISTAATALAEELRAAGVAATAPYAAAGDYKTYSEVNMTGTASVTTDSGLTFKTAISIDAGQGYDLADDDQFDTVKANGRNGGSVGLDYVSIGGAFGTITIDEGDIPHLVDADDNLSGDISYKGTFGDVTVQAVFDQAKDGNAVAVAADAVNNVTGVDPDVAWSAAVSGAIQGVSYRYATDEEGGYAGSLGYTMSGVTVGVSTKLEAAEKDLNKPVHNGVSVAYAVEGLSLNGAWDSVKDGNQTSWGVGYTGGDATVGFNTNQKNEWTATASVALGAGASLNAGVNYTDDAQVGVSFSF